MIYQLYIKHKGKLIIETKPIDLGINELIIDIR